ncbi:MAG TPA: hypothetical protein VFI13_11565 [Gemmatimonadales bacterium]|nr:hypothetical protein [Gemmatimonadales bacterium]
MFTRTLRLTLLLLPAAAPLAAQGEVLDQGTLSIRVADVEVGHEQFTLTAGRRGGTVGSTLHSVTSYPAVRPDSRFDAILERSATQTLAAFQVEVAGVHQGRTVAELARNRFTVRSASGTQETAHEYPGGPDLVALDDSVYALWLAVADLATEEGITLSAIAPRSGWRGHFTARRVSNGDAPPSIQLTGDIEGTILLDDRGRFAGLQIPSRRLEVLRDAE